MASQPVARPWFRLSSMARPPTQPALPAQDTQPVAPNPQPPPILHPTFTTLSPPTPPPPVSATPPTPSPKFTKQSLAQSPPNSPNIKARAPPPSPLLLPPSMLNPNTEMASKNPIEAEQKSVITQQTIEKPSSNWVNENSPKTVPNPSVHHGKTHEKGSHHKKGHNSDENGMRVITIAGENRGAFMELIHSHKKHGHFEGISHSLLHKKNGNDSETSSSDEGKLKMKDDNHKNMVNAYMNSNVQGVNNSIVFNSAYTHHDPGVNLSLTRKPNGGGHHKMTQAKDNAHHSNGYHS